VQVGFSLTKWYLDVVTEDGALAIAYWAEVRWQRLRQPLCGLLLRGTDGESALPWRFSGRAVAPPALDATGLGWHAAPLELTVECLRRAPAFRHRLLDTTCGVLDWHCEVPRAAVRLRAGETVVEGAGYAERIELSLLPWRIPADEIRWGRFLAGGISVVWIEWRGECPRQLVFVDGRRAQAPSISGEAVEFNDGFRLSLDAPRVVSEEGLGDLLAPLDTLRPLLEPITRTHQTRWLARGALRDPAGLVVRGWALHELVRRR
jgi:hypothetical protein